MALKRSLPLAHNCARILLAPQQCQFYRTPRQDQQNYVVSILARSISSQRLNKNMELITDTPRPVKRLGDSSSSGKLAVERSGPGSTVGGDHEPPLVIIMSWLMAKKKHTMKYAKFYLDQGFHVLCVSCTPIQLLFPTYNGGIMIGKDILNFMVDNPQYRSKMIHGFSISGFVWGQTMATMAGDLEKYQPVIDTIVGQIWDSPVDVEGISQGMGTAMFPNNRLLKELIEWYVRFHVNTFQQSAMQHYVHSSMFYHNTIVRSPALFFCSEDDPVAFWYICQRAMDRWEQLGVKVFQKVWKSSPHVSHMWKHTQEYQEEMKAFLDYVGLLKYPEKFKVEAKKISLEIN